MTANIVGFVQYESAGEATQEICAAIQAVLSGPEPSEAKVRDMMWQRGGRDIALNFRPHAGVNGEIYGGRMAQFRFRATWNGHEIAGGTLKSAP